MQQRFEQPVLEQQQLIPSGDRARKVEVQVSFDRKDNTFLIKAVVDFIKDVHRAIQNQVVHIAVSIQKMQAPLPKIKQAVSHLIAQILHSPPSQQVSH